MGAIGTAWSRVDSPDICREGSRQLEGLCTLRAAAYGIHWWQLPATMFVSIAVHLLEVPGMFASLPGQRPPQLILSMMRILMPIVDPWFR